MSPSAADARVVSAALTSASVDGTTARIVVRFHLSGEELDRDDAMHVVAGSDALQQWDEDWTLQRDGVPDTAAVDEQHALLTEEGGGWMFAHRGWVVTAIRLPGGADPLDPENI